MKKSQRYMKDFRVRSRMNSRNLGNQRQSLPGPEMINPINSDLQSIIQYPQEPQSNNNPRHRGSLEQEQFDQMPQQLPRIDNANNQSSKQSLYALDSNRSRSSYQFLTAEQAIDNKGKPGVQKKTNKDGFNRRYNPKLDKIRLQPVLLEKIRINNVTQ